VTTSLIFKGLELVSIVVSI